ELLPLCVREAQGRQLGGVVGVTVAVGVHVRQAGRLAEDLDDAAVVRGNPFALGAVVVAGRDRKPNGEVEEVIDVVVQRLVERDGGGPGGDGLIGGQFDGVGVAGGGGQVAGHGLQAVGPDGEFGGAEVQGRQGLGGAVGQGHGRLRALADEQS